MNPEAKRVADAVFNELMARLQEAQTRAVNLVIENAILKARVAELETPKPE